MCRRDSKLRRYSANWAPRKATACLRAAIEFPGPGEGLGACVLVVPKGLPLGLRVQELALELGDLPAEGELLLERALAQGFELCLRCVQVLEHPGRDLVEPNLLVHSLLGMGER